jgi:PKD repeat protein
MSNKTSQFSSRGPTWDGRTKPDIVAYGEGVISDRATGTTIRGGTPVGQYYIAMSGTSMSCPQVSAACAILLEKNRSLKPIDIKNVLLNSVKHIDTKYPNNNNGWGLLNVGAALNNVSSLVAPVASYTANVTMGDAPLTVQFTDTSSNSPTSWDWNFGDGTPNNNLQNPVYTYNTPGVYSVTLTASNSAGSNQKIMTGYINVSEKPAPVANFTANAITGDAPLTVQFTDTSSNSPTSWDWNFGDGTPDNNLQNPTHQYTSAGTYAVTLTVTNDGGSNTIVKANYITANNAPLTADFTANKTSGNAPLAIQFNDASTGNGITAWAWDFGDGATSALQNPVHLYTTVGNYSVTLTVTNANDTNSTTKTNYIHVLPIYPAADFSGTPLSGYDDAPLDVSFTDLSTGYPTGWSWYFGDGTTSALQNPAHQYTAAGTYTVNLTITNTNGSNTMSKKDYITVIPHWLNASFIS